jgi:hypothetical protein
MWDRLLSWFGNGAAGCPAGDVLPEQMFKRLKRRFVLPAARRGEIGGVVEIPIRLLIPDEAYHYRADFLKICEHATPEQLRQTRYWKSRTVLGHDAEYIENRMASYTALLKSVREDGIVTDPSDPGTYPILFAHGNIHQRMDGAHRASVYRFLGHRTAEVWLVTVAEVLARIELPRAMRKALEGELCFWVEQYVTDTLSDDSDE